MNGGTAQFARVLAKYEPEPVGPDLELAREAVAQVFEDQRLGGVASDASDVRKGDWDDTNDIQSALRAIKLLRERGE